LIAELERAIRASGQPLRVVAAKADIPERTVTRIIHRQVDPKLGTLISIARAIGYDIALVKRKGQK
jgi:DNA-binding phage protein